MKIAVCIKQVPSVHEITIDENTHTLNRDGVEQIMNPSDENALEAAFQIRDELDSIVNLFSMGNLSAQTVLKEGLQRGADKAYLASDSVFAGSDTYSTAIVLSSAINTIGKHDLIICGSRTVDGETGQVGPELAVMLGMPCITNVIEIDNIDENSMTCLRQIDNGKEMLKAEFPILITINEGINKLRLPSILNMQKRNEKEIVILDNHKLNIDKGLVGLVGSPTKVKKVFVSKTEGRNGKIKNVTDDVIIELVKDIRKVQGRI